MRFLKKYKGLSHKESSVVAFVLALMSVLSTALVTYSLPHVSRWLLTKGLMELHFFVLITAAVIYLSIQGLLLFGFPLYYVQDKKSHMTGFQILLYTLLWIFVFALIIVSLSFMFSGGGASIPVEDVL